MSFTQHQARGGALAIAAFAITALVSGTCASLALPARASALAAPTASPATVFYDCNGWHDGQVRPRAVLIDCGFQNVFLTGGDRPSDRMTWTWTAAVASSHAVLWVNSCNPDCAAGRYDEYAATLTLWRPETQDGARYFSRMTLRYHHGWNRVYQYKWYTLSGTHEPAWQGGP